jgi:hypothetical protein
MSNIPRKVIVIVYVFLTFHSFLATFWPIFGIATNWRHWEKCIIKKYGIGKNAP